MCSQKFIHTFYKKESIISSTLSAHSAVTLIGTPIDAVFQSAKLATAAAQCVTG